MNLRKRHRQTTRNILIGVIVLMLSLGGTACEASPLAPQDTPTPQATPTATLPPTPTPLPQTAVLVAPPDMDANQVEQARQQVEPLAQSSNFVLELRQTVARADLQPNWKVVVFLRNPAEINDLAAAAPQTQFVTISNAEMQPSANLTIIRQRPEKQAFVAGYLTTLIAPDWRAAGVLPSDEPDGQMLSSAFRNGGSYFCGRCPSVLSPVVLFPLTVSLPAASDIVSITAAVDELRNTKIIYNLYIAPEMANPELMYALASAGLVLTGGQVPPDNIRPRYAATIGYAPLNTLAALWPEISAGQGGKTVDASLQISDINTDFLSSGRLELIKQVVKGLDGGFILATNP